MLLPDPCFIETLRRNSGVKRVLVHVMNAMDQARRLTIANVTKPEWLDLEKAMIGDVLEFRRKAKLPIIVNLNTENRFFPGSGPIREEIKIEFADGESMSIWLNIQEIVSSQATFRGVFAIDFGTTNTCWAWKARVGEGLTKSDLEKPPLVSREVPTLIRYKDISRGESPAIEIGATARDYIARNSGRSFSYVISVKRMLGQEKEYLILDERSGMDPDRFQRYRPEIVASHLIAAFIKEAESKIGGRIENVVATFPILYNQRKRQALRHAFAKAFESLNRPWSDDRLTLRLDETNAAAFNYVRNRLMDEFRKFSVTSAGHRLLSYDFGGGTVDVSLLDVDLARDPAGRISITTHSKGITGDAYLGGDVVTLQVVKLLKLKLALKGAQLRVARLAAEAAAREAAKAAEAKGAWGSLGSLGAPAAPAAASGGFDWGSLAAPAAETKIEAAPAEEAEEDPETADIHNLTEESRLNAAVQLLAEQAEVLELSAAWGLGITATLARLVAQGTRNLSEYHLNDLARQIAEAIDIVLPTSWRTLEENGDLISTEMAKKLFFELWLPAEVMKIRAVTDPTRRAALTEPLHKIAKYLGVRPDELMGLAVTEDEINAAVEPMLRRSIGKAAYLLKTVDASSGLSSGGLSFGGLGAASDARPVTILLAGNSARLPIVRRLVAEIMGVEDRQIVMDPGGVKASVAQGACEEECLLKDFGGGLIRYEAGDFTNRIPYSIGLFNRELSLIGFSGGFAPVVPRGTPVESQVLLTDALQVVHRTMETLSLFAYYHDHDLAQDPATAGEMAQVQPTSLGWFDLTKPEAGTWGKAFTAEVESQLAATANTYRLVLAMDKDRDLTLVDPATKQFWRLIPTKELYPDAENPFSGIH